MQLSYMQTLYRIVKLKRCSLFTFLLDSAACRLAMIQSFIMSNNVDLLTTRVQCLGLIYHATKARSALSDHTIRNY